MDYTDALKQVQKQPKPRENYMLLQFGYDKKFILPYKDAIACLATLSNAELLQENYSDPSNIVGMKKDSIEVRVFSVQEYERTKISGLLKIPLRDLENSDHP